MLTPKELRKICSSCRKQAWIGGLSQANMELIDISACTNYRVASNLHHQFDCVWIYENTLEAFGDLSWKLILDESIRLLQKKGLLVIRFQENRNFSLPMLKTYIGRRYGLSVTIEFETSDVVVFEISRLRFEIYQENTWTFAILTQGKERKANVMKFLSSIRKNDEDCRHQILVCGPKDEDYSKFNVDYIDTEIFDDSKFAEIAKKKNIIALNAKNENLLICHDRYYLPDDFFRSFEKFGYDFDFVTIAQETESGVRYPYYCALYQPNLSWTHPIDVRDLNVLLDTQYVNGGLMIFKRTTLLAIKFNELLHWCQMEDVEISHQFCELSIPPRINFLTKAKVIEVHGVRADDYKKFDYFLNGKFYKVIDDGNRSDHIGCMLTGLTKKKKSKKIVFKKKFPFVSLKRV